MMDFFVDENLPNLIKLEDYRNKSDSKETNVEGTGRVEHVFNAINANLNSELVNKTGAIFQFNVKGIYIFFLHGLSSFTRKEGSKGCLIYRHFSYNLIFFQ